MDNYKFRGRRLDNKEWVYGYAVKRGSEWWIFNETVDWNINPPFGEITYHQYKVDLSTVGQFTGLCDRNGKEIYKGHIVKRITDLLCDPYDEFVGMVKFINGSFMIESLDGKDGTYLWSDCQELEIVGDIYQEATPNA